MMKAKNYLTCLNFFATPMTQFPQKIGQSLFLLLLVALFTNAFGQTRDTSLLTLYSHPYYYNVVKDWKGTIYAGTTEGVFRMNLAAPEKMDNRIGYLKIDNKGQAVIDANGIKYHQQTDMNHLLPFPGEKRDEYHAGIDNFFYITSGGRMHIYEILPYSFAFRNHSVRTISANFTGTYSGIYFRNRRLPFPVSQFTDGFIREYNGKVFMCTNGLDVFDIKSLESGTPKPALQLPSGFEFIPCRDIRYISLSKKYVIASGNSLAVMDSSLLKIKNVFTGNPDEETVLHNELPEHSLIYFSSGNRSYVFNANTNTVQLGLEASETIVDGVFLQKSQILLTSNGLYIKQGEDSLQKKIELRKAHTLCKIGEATFIIATDEGLMYYQLDENKSSTIIPGIEFNRGALHVKDKKLFAGSVRGLYILDLSNLENLITFNEKNQTGITKQSIPYWFIIVFLVTVVSLLLLNQRYRKRLRTLEITLTQVGKGEQTPKPRLQRQEIESFIQNHLHTASLKTIIEHFQTNNSMVYAVLNPEKPGDLIQKLRYEKVTSMRKEVKSVQEIAAVTGLSHSYIRKIWNG
jgi:hypothetical protein